MKQKNKSWIPWLFLYGWSNAGKTTLGNISNCIWNNFNNPNYAIPFTAIDTKAKLGEAISQSTLPLVINEIAPLSDDNVTDWLLAYVPPLGVAVTVGPVLSIVYVSSPTGPALPNVSYPINLRVVVVLMVMGPAYAVLPSSGVLPSVV